MNSFEFVLRRLARMFGYANERGHVRMASQLTHYLTEAEDLLGRVAWRDVDEVPELREEHWKIKEIENQQERLEQEIKEIEVANDSLIERRDKLEFASEERLSAISVAKTDAMRDALALMHEVEASRAAGDLTKKKYSGLRMKMKVLTESGGSADEIGRTSAEMEELKAQYAIDKRKIAELTNRIHGAEEKVSLFEGRIEEVRAEARSNMASMMHEVSKSSKRVADYTARIGALDVTKKNLSYRVGAFLSRNSDSDDPDVKPVLKKYKNILGKVAQLRRSIRYHRILAGREGEGEEV